MYRGDAKRVKDHIGTLEARLQLIEEMAELQKALCKQIRAEGLVDNPTPVTIDEAEAAVDEEAKDVLMCMYILGLLPNEAEPSVADNPKWTRWAKRLGCSEAKIVSLCADCEHSLIGCPDQDDEKVFCDDYWNGMRIPDVV